MENLELNIFCSMTLFKKMINNRDVSKKLILGTFTFLFSISNSSNFTGKISNMLFYCQTQCFSAGGGVEVEKSSENGFRVLLRL